LIGSFVILLVAYFANSQKLHAKADQNHQAFVVGYLQYQAVLYFVTRTLGFWIEQSPDREIRDRHVIVLFFIFFFMIYAQTYFTMKAWGMNEDLTKAEAAQESKMDL